MAIYVNSNADKKTATAAMIDIEIRFPQMVDVIEKAEKCLDFTPETRTAFQNRVFDTGMLMSADLAMREIIRDHQRQDVSYIIRTYLSDKLESKKYTKMLSGSNMLIKVYDLRRVPKLSENDRAILEYFGYFDLGMQYRSSCRFVRHRIGNTDAYAMYILIDEKFKSKYSPLRAVLYHEFGHYQQYENGKYDNGGDEAHEGKGSRAEHNADWYAVKRLYQEGHIDDIRKMIDGHIKRYVETELEESLYRANLIKRACRRYGMKI